MFKSYTQGMGYIILTVLILALLGGLIKTSNVFGERILFKNSFQYSEGMEQRAITIRAQIAAIDAHIIQNPEMRQQLSAQRKVLEIQLQGAR